ncbi:hypothetical protein [Streptomyces sp. NPDC057580]|uniref:hypothetical protein n=1 Tax=Streptomyces sp. NPDC057580 TaxID=3346173 RepID=UPI0036CEDC21
MGEGGAGGTKSAAGRRTAGSRAGGRLVARAGPRGWPGRARKAETEDDLDAALASTVPDGAQQLLEDGGRLVDGLDIDAPAGPARMLSRPFLRVTREYLYTEANRHLRLRPAGRSLFGRLSTG